MKTGLFRPRLLTAAVLAALLAASPVPATGEAASEETTPETAATAAPKAPPRRLTAEERERLIEQRSVQKDVTAAEARLAEAKARRQARMKATAEARTAANIQTIGPPASPVPAPPIPVTPEDADEEDPIGPGLSPWLLAPMILIWPLIVAVLLAADRLKKARDRR